MPSAEFEHAIPEMERLHTDAWHRLVFLYMGNSVQTVACTEEYIYIDYWSIT